MNWFADIGKNLIDNISIEIGGGVGWWCQKCGKFYRDMPIKNIMCNNVYKISQINNDKIRDIIHTMGDVSDKIINHYINNPTQMCEEIESIFRSENSYQTIEEASYDIIYNNLMELILERYHSDVYEKISVICDSQIFNNEKRNGLVIVSHKTDIIDVNTKVLTQISNDDVYVPQKFYFIKK